MIGIYIITNKINHKCYIGQSQNIERRWREHRRRALKHSGEEYNSLLHKAIRKHGLENFSFQVVEECAVSELNKREIYWIGKFNSRNPQFGYNLTDGGSEPHENILSKTDVAKIKNLLKQSTLTQTDIAKQFHITQRTVSYINHGDIWCDSKEVYPLRLRKKKEYICPECGQPMSSKSLVCLKCRYEKMRICPLPNRSILKSEIRLDSFSDIAKRYGVSPTTIRRWCKQLNLPFTKNEISSITDQQWLLI